MFHIKGLIIFNNNSSGVNKTSAHYSGLIVVSFHLNHSKNSPIQLSNKKTDKMSFLRSHKNGIKKVISVFQQSNSFIQFHVISMTLEKNYWVMYVGYVCHEIRYNSISCRFIARLLLGFPSHYENFFIFFRGLWIEWW